MNRRNVLGNRIEESKTLWVILTGILVTGLQFVIYHFVSGGWLGILLASVLVLAGSVVVHFITGEQEELMGYLLIPCVFSGAMGVLLPYAEIPFFPEKGTMLIGCLFTWLIPVVYAIIYTWINGNPAISGFARFYIRAYIFFYVVYFALILYGLFFHRTAVAEGNAAQWIPFATFAALVNGVIKGVTEFSEVTGFLLNRVVVFLPYGFFIGLVGRKLHGMVRMILLLLLPALIELVQLLFRFGTCDVDDIIFRFLGALLGFFCFLLFDAAFEHFTARHFDGSEIDRDYYGRKI